MDREIVEKKVEALEKRVRWQMRAIIGLIIESAPKSRFYFYVKRVKLRV